jgi:predicted extracellular nuclease
MHKSGIFILFVFLIILSCSSEKKKFSKHLTVVFYNVENLFDLKDEPGKSDEEFTPEGEKKWTQERYSKKLADISRVLASVNPDELPEIIGLCEVENRKVLEDLINHRNIAKGKYKIVHHESPDFRGIDCALIYRPKEFKVLEHFPVRVVLHDKPDYKTRDILYVKGKSKNKEELHIFVNHWPSRTGGVANTEPIRVGVAMILREKVDSILKISPEANIIVMGDMNDEPINKSMVSTLGAAAPAYQGSVLKNLMFGPDNEGKGTYNYRGNWNMLDNMVVSESLLDEEGFRCVEKTGFIFRREWMEYKNQDGDLVPNRTYGGPNYYGGISDHFPVYFKLELPD